MDLAQPRVNGTQVTYGDDKGLLVEFVDDAVYQPYESEREGRAIYKNVPFLQIIYPGDKTKKTYRPATEADKMRFKAQWDFFKDGSLAGEQGTPITQWNYLSKSQAMELKHMGFWTVELVANASDQAIGSFMGGMLLRKQAQAFLAETKGDSKITSLVAENEKLKEDMKVMTDTIAAMQSQIASLQEKPSSQQKTTLKLKGE